MIHNIDPKLITNILGVFLIIYLPIIFYFLLKTMKVKHDTDLD